MDADQAAEELTRKVKAKVGAEHSSEVICPREKSFMTPCVARDGSLAVSDDEVCVGCGLSPRTLLVEFT